MTNVKHELKSLIVTSLRLTDCKPEDLKDDEALLGGELEVDSIDILQLILETERHFKIKLVEGAFNEAAWKSIDSLSAVIESQLAAKGSG